MKGTFSSCRWGRTGNSVVKLERFVAIVSKTEQKLNIITLTFGVGFKWTTNEGFHLPSGKRDFFS